MDILVAVLPASSSISPAEIFFCSADKQKIHPTRYCDLAISEGVFPERLPAPRPVIGMRQNFYSTV
jgi:hypothetical protein